MPLCRTIRQHKLSLVMCYVVVYHLKLLLFLNSLLRMFQVLGRSIIEARERLSMSPAANGDLSKAKGENH